jgi:hypothetical protein
MARKFVANKKRGLLFLPLFCFTSFPLQAASIAGKTNEAVISFPAPYVDLESNLPSEVLVDRFFQETVASDSIVFDRFIGPASRLSWARQHDALGYSSIEHFNDRGAAMFAAIASDSLRTAATAALPLDLWEDHWQGWFGRLLSGTLGNPEEEHIRMTSISYSAVRSSWEKFNEKGGVQWGLRPWRTNPYIYFLAHAGRLAGQPLFTFEGRAGYSLFASATLQARVTLQLPASFRIAGAAIVDPFRMASASHQTGGNHFALTLERVVRSSSFTPEAVFYVGFRSGINGNLAVPRQDNQIVAGFFKHW